MVMRGLSEVTWQVVVMFIVAVTAITTAYILTEMSPEQYFTLLQLILAFFTGYLTGRISGVMSWIISKRTRD
jgi:uncharacterized membrane protein